MTRLHGAEFLIRITNIVPRFVAAGLCVAHVVFEVIFKGRQFSEAVTPFLQFYSAPW